MISQFFIVILGWSLVSFVRKDIIQYLNNIQTITLIHISYQFALYMLLIYVLLFDKSQIEGFYDNLKKIPLSIYLGGSLVAILLVFESFSLNKLFKTYDVNFIIPLVSGISTVLIFIIGYYFYKESITFRKIAGVLFIITGICVISRNKIK